MQRAAALRFPILGMRHPLQSISRTHNNTAVREGLQGGGPSGAARGGALAAKQ